MSTFGRKALIWWDYENHSKENALRYNHTPPEIQLQILHKWYPIGMKFKNITNWGVMHGYNNIITYEQNNAGIYLIKYKSDIHTNEYTQNPVLTQPEENFLKALKRKYKIEKLLN
jgi:hypothetical protein